MSRLSVPDEAGMTPRQAEVRAAIVAGPRGRLDPPLAMWLYSPELALKAQDLGAFCRYGTSLPRRLSELAILITAAWWKSPFEWTAHAPLAREAGLAAAVVEALRRREEPEFVRADEACVHAFATELLEQRRVSGATFQRTCETLGQAGVVELVGILGYYGLISMTINAFEISASDGRDPFADMRER